eukprot:1549383-Heterocapsa_arctica.AAC.1
MLPFSVPCICLFREAESHGNNLDPQETELPTDDSKQNEILPALVSCLLYQRNGVPREEGGH